ncbi:aminotransferase-like domain-containing protein [Couchioplanes azureus]|uniref:aminotransferase-like domain-containing protein n=1 Tax=Couchioplanes caeruleus TaxID=56438 RepID=UPI0016716C85|nr:PLP-dependent aminotransferase family protein [Couchioplanes caeruleus]
MTSMNLLNEVSARHPGAISFAAGRPADEGIEVADVHRYLDLYCAHLARDRGYTDRQVRAELLQYGRTKGIVHDLVARALARDEDIVTDPEAVVITSGAQEAMVLLLRALAADERDVVLAADPTYVGFTGAARLVGVPVHGVRDDGTGVDLDDLARVLAGARDAGRRPRALYLVPDFANPTGTSMPVDVRRRLLDLAAEHELLLIEDNPYGMFQPAATRPPTLKALDRHGVVVYVGSFAKTVLPGARIGYAVADQPVRGGGLLADELAKLKSMLTVNTSPIAQAVIGGKLLEDGCSLVASTRRVTGQYLAGLRRIGEGLAARLTGVPGVRWNRPAGGFFTVVTVGFPVDDALLHHAAERHGVLFTPMRHFYHGDGGEYQLRLSSSAVRADEIDDGLDRLAALIRERSG